MAHVDSVMATCPLIKVRITPLLMRTSPQVDVSVCEHQEISSEFVTRSTGPELQILYQTIRKLHQCLSQQVPNLM